MLTFFLHQISSLRFSEVPSHIKSLYPNITRELPLSNTISRLDVDLAGYDLLSRQELDATIHFGIDATVLGLPLSGRFARIVAWQNNRQLAQWCIGREGLQKGKAHLLSVIAGSLWILADNDSLHAHCLVVLPTIVRSSTFLRCLTVPWLRIGSYGQFYVQILDDTRADHWRINALNLDAWILVTLLSFEVGLRENSRYMLTLWLQTSSWTLGKDVLPNSNLVASWGIQRVWHHLAFNAQWPSKKEGDRTRLSRMILEVLLDDIGCPSHMNGRCSFPK